MECLAFESFSHGNTEELHVDSIKLGKSGAVVREIRVIPSGFKVNIPGLDCWGSTIPSHFELEIFATPFGKENCTFRKLGNLQYVENEETMLKTDLNQPISELLVRGSYSSITLVLLGEISVKTEPRWPTPIVQKPIQRKTAGGPPITQTRLQQPVKIVLSPPVTSQPLFVASAPLLLSPVSSGAPIPTIGGASLIQLTVPPMAFNPNIPPPVPGILGQPPPIVVSAPMISPRMPVSSGIPLGFDPTRPPPLFTSAVLSPPSPIRRPHTPTRPQVVSSILSPGRMVPKLEPKVEIDDFEVTSEPPAKRPSPAPLSELGGDSISDSESQEGFDFENISEDEFEYDETVSGDVEMTEADEDLLNRTTAQFSAVDLRFHTIKYFQKPWVSEYELAVNSGKFDEEETQKLEDAVRLLGSLDLTSVDSQDVGAKCSEWLETVEPLVTKICTTLAGVKDDVETEVMDALYNWTFMGLNKSFAVRQPKAPYITRHLKIGIRMALKMTTITSEVTGRLIKGNVQHKLLDLLEDKFMTLPFKLMILEALDSSTTPIEGINAFLKTVNNNGTSLLTAYQRLANSLVDKQSARFVVAAKALLRKAAFFESLIKCQEFSVKVSSIPSVDGEFNIGDEISSDEINSLITCLKDILMVYRNSDVLITINRLNLPVSKTFEIRQPSSENMAVYRYFLENAFLESLSVLCTSGLLMCSSAVAGVVKSLLNELFTNQNGLLFLLHLPEQTKHLVATLLQQEQEDPSEVDERGPLYQTAVELAGRLQALLLVDSLLDCGSKSHLTDDNEAIMLESLHQLHSLSLTAVGRRCTTRVLSNERNLQALLQFMRLTGDPEADARLRKSASAGYAAELLLLTVRCSPSAQMLTTFSQKLLIASGSDAETRSSKLTELRQWVEPLKKCPPIGPEAVEYFSEKIKAYVEEGLTSKIPKGMVTSLRILKSFTVAPDYDEDTGRPREIKYDDALLRIFGLDMLPSLLQLITKLCNLHLINWQQGLSCVSREGTLFLGAIIPSVTIVRALLCNVIKARESDFKDASAVKPLLSVYTLCCSMPPVANVTSPENHQIRSEVVRALLAFTIPSLEIEGKTGNKSSTLLRNSVWTKMLLEILNFAGEALHNFVGAVTALSELIPLPLPVQTDKPLSNDEVSQTLNSRCLWAAHLTSVEFELRRLIGDLALTSHSTLHNSIRRLCVQLCDLNPHTATMVGKALLDSTLENLHTTENDENKTVAVPADIHLANLINLLSYLCSQAPAKMTFLTLFQAGSEPYSALLGRLLETLNLVSSSFSHLSCQESIVSLLMSLCDEEISLLNDQQTDSRSPRSLPSLQQLQDICSALLTHVGESKHGYNTVIPTLRVLLMFCEYDYGLFLIQNGLNQDNNPLESLLARLVSEFNVHSSDCLSTLHITLDFIRSVLSLPEVTDKSDTKQSRTKAIRRDTLRLALKWKKDNNDHPLCQIETLLKKHSEDEFTLKTILKNVHELITILSDSTEHKLPELQEPNLGTLPELTQLFEGRQVWVKFDPLDDQLRLTSHYWFPSCALEEMAEESDGEKIVSDLEAVRQEFLPQFDPKDELGKKVSSKHIERVKRKPTRPGIINTSKGGEGKKIMGPPLRGRGFVPRGHVTPRFNDTFRTRAQNTSRAPSMHVDDFIVMEAISTDVNKERGGSRDSGGSGKRGSRHASPRPVHRDISKPVPRETFLKPPDARYSNPRNNSKNRFGDRRPIVHRPSDSRKPARSFERRPHR